MEQRADVELVPVTWREGKGAYYTDDETLARPDEGQWILVPEPYSPIERPGFVEFLREQPARTAELPRHPIDLHQDLGHCARSSGLRQRTWRPPAREASATIPWRQAISA